MTGTHLELYLNFETMYSILNVVGNKFFISSNWP
jgi:hypothetical protein